MIACPSGKTHLSTCGLMLIFSMPGDSAEAGHVDLVVEVADVAHDRLVLHPRHVRRGDDVLVAGGGDEDVGLLEDFVERFHLVALHRRLQRADRVDLGDDHPRALAPQRFRAALADVAEAAHDGDLATDHHVGRPVDAVDQGVPAAVEVVELGLRDGVVDVDRREQQLARLDHLVQAVHAGRRLLGHAFDALTDLRPALRVLAQRAGQQREDHGELLGLGARRIRYRAGRLVLGALVHEQRRVAAVVEDHVRPRFAVRCRLGPAQHLVGAPPVLLERLALPGVDGHAARLLDGPLGADGHGRRRVVLGGEDVAAAPAHLRAERRQRLDQDGRLDGHVQRPGDAGALQRL